MSCKDFVDMNMVSVAAADLEDDNSDWPAFLATVYHSIVTNEIQVHWEGGVKGGGYKEVPRTALEHLRRKIVPTKVEEILGRGRAQVNSLRLGVDSPPLASNCASSARQFTPSGG